MTSSLLERVALTAKARDKTDREFRDALRLAREHHSLSEVAAAANLSITGVRYLADNLNARRPAKRRRKGET
ncbi:MAG TPA: hypothetical protein VGF24_37215 [Vicinamibacterales bacterium]|jgi:DNA-binding CsgD family transcriptional regulator